MNKIILFFLLIVFVNGIVKGYPLFELFIEGVKDSFRLIKPIFTTMMAFVLFVQLMRSSGCIDIISNLLHPILNMFHIPVDIAILALLRPISANASLSFLYSFYELFGVDHPLSLLATCIQSGSDTTLYVISLYFSSVHMKKTGYSLWIGLFMDFLSVILAVFFYLKIFV